MKLRILSGPEEDRAPIRKAFPAIARRLGVQSSEIDIDLEIGPLDDEFSGATACVVINDRLLVRINTNLPRAPLGTTTLHVFCHEMVHVAQIVTGRLDGDHTLAIFDGQLYLNGINMPRYKDQPWEREANEMSGILYEEALKCQ